MQVRLGVNSVVPGVQPRRDEDAGAEIFGCIILDGAAGE
jgi:hypothetical protein